MRGRTYGPLAPVLTAVLLVGGWSLYLVRDSISAYDSLSKPPLALPYYIMVVLVPALWLLTGAGVSSALGSRCHPDAKLDVFRLFAAQLFLSGLLPVCLLRWDLLLISFALGALLLAVLCGLTAACARAEESTGTLLFPRILFSAYCLYLLLGVCVLG